MNPLLMQSVVDQHIADLARASQRRGGRPGRARAKHRLLTLASAAWFLSGIAFGALIG